MYNVPCAKKACNPMCIIDLTINSTLLLIQEIKRLKVQTNKNSTELYCHQLWLKTEADEIRKDIAYAR